MVCGQMGPRACRRQWASGHDGRACCIHPEQLASSHPLTPPSHPILARIDTGECSSVCLEGARTAGEVGVRIWLLERGKERMAMVGEARNRGGCDAAQRSSIRRSTAASDGGAMALDCSKGDAHRTRSRMAAEALGLPSHEPRTHSQPLAARRRTASRTLLSSAS